MPMQLLDLKGVERVAMQNTVAINILMKSLQQDPELQEVQITWDFSHHPWYPSIRAKRISSQPKQGCSHFPISSSVMGLSGNE